MAFTREVYRPIIRLVILLIILFVIRWILLQVTDVMEVRLPWVPFSIGALISAVIGIIALFILLSFRRDFAPKVQEAWPSYPETGKIVSSSVFIIIIIVLYITFKDLVHSFLTSNNDWLFGFIMFLIALWPIYILVMTLYRSSSSITETVTTKLAEDSGELVKCSKCGAMNPGKAKFCAKCSAPIGKPEVVKIKCPKCGAENMSDAVFCINCAGKLEDTKPETKVAEEEEEFEF